MNVCKSLAFFSMLALGSGSLAEPIVQQAYLKASNTETGDLFGQRASISGNTLVIGTNFEDSGAAGVNGNQSDNSASSSGAAYVFVRDASGAWTQQAYLKASNTDANDLFGSSVAISGDTIVVGANGEDSHAIGINGDQADNGATAAGAAYVFVRNGTSWSQQAYLKASNTEAFDNFGLNVAISGDTILVGARAEDSAATGVNGNQTDNSAPSSGAVYVFVRNGTAWSQQAYLKASNTEANDWFGQSVSISGDILVVSALQEDSSATGINGNQSDNSAVDSGAAYVFVRNGATWSQEAYLKASNTDAADFFGPTVAVSGETVVVGAAAEDSNATGVNGNQADNTAADSGAAYVFVRKGGIWTQQAYLKASNNDAGDGFGSSLALDGDELVVSASGEDSAATGVDGNPSDNSAPSAGAAYLFRRDGTMWIQQAYLKASNAQTGDLFGPGAGISGGTAVVCAFQEGSGATGVNGDQANNIAPASGAAYVFIGIGSADADGDSVPDSVDVCPNNEPGLAVDCAGRPLRDCNHDCLVDGGDVQCIVDELLSH